MAAPLIDAPTAVARPGAHHATRHAAARCTAVVPTLGASPFLEASLAALREDGGSALEIVVVEQTATPLAERTVLADRVVRMPEGGGFTAANNRAITDSTRPFVATVNDDALVDPGWLAALVDALDEDPRAAAVQGWVRRLDQPRRLDGAGLAWNRYGQATQRGHGTALDTVLDPVTETTTQEIFGVSATVALYRRAALEQVTPPTTATGPTPFFDPRLGSYYEDVDLACRLRAAGWTALCVPVATARHAGSTSSAGRAMGATPQVYGNRLLVLAKVLGRAFWPRLPAFLLRDAIDAWHHARHGQLWTVVGIAAGWLRALTQLPRFGRLGAPRVPPRVLRGAP